MVVMILWMVHGVEESVTIFFLLKVIFTTLEHLAVELVFYEAERVFCIRYVFENLLEIEYGAAYDVIALERVSSCSLSLASTSP